MILSLERITDTLPVGFAELMADARADGHDHMSRLAAEFAQSPAIFHAIFACHLAALYVHRKVRRRKVARVIANALLQEAAWNVSTVTVDVAPVV